MIAPSVTIALADLRRIESDLIDARAAMTVWIDDVACGLKPTPESLAAGVARASEAIGFVRALDPTRNAAHLAAPLPLKIAAE